MPRAQCIVHRKNRLLMVKHRLNGEEWWCLPGGGIEEGESPSEAAVRELKEELNIEVNEEDLEPFSFVSYRYTVYKFCICKPLQHFSKQIGIANEIYDIFHC